MRLTLGGAIIPSENDLSSAPVATLDSSLDLIATW